MQNRSVKREGKASIVSQFGVDRGEHWQIFHKFDKTMLWVEPKQAHHSFRGFDARMDIKGTPLVDPIAAHVTIAVIILIMIFCLLPMQNDISSIKWDGTY